MKINIDQYPAISSYFKARANPSAPAYEPLLWNDCSHNEYEHAVDRYALIWNKIASIFDTRMDNPAAIAEKLATYSDDNFRLMTGRPLTQISTMRQTLMGFLSTTCMSTNCFAYGLNIRTGFRPGDLLTPGYLKQVGGTCDVSLQGKKLSVLFDGLAEDGFHFFKGHPDNDPVPAGYYLAAILVEQSKGKIQDIHIVRYDQDGGCSHKRGHYNVSRTDFKGQLIIDPTMDGAFNPYRYEGSILVPSVLPQCKVG